MLLHKLSRSYSSRAMRSGGSRGTASSAGAPWTGTTNGNGLSARHPDSGPVPAEEDAREMAILVLVRLIAEVRKIHTRQTGINATARLYGFR